MVAIAWSIFILAIVLADNQSMVTSGLNHKHGAITGGFFLFGFVALCISSFTKD